MSTRVEAPPIKVWVRGTILIAIVVALVVGAYGRKSRHSRHRERWAAPSWTPVYVGQKLEAMEGPLLAEQSPSRDRAVAWDAGKLQQMEGHQLAEQSRTEAMEDRQLAEDIHRHRPVGGPLG